MMHANPDVQIIGLIGTVIASIVAAALKARSPRRWMFPLLSAFAAGLATELLLIKMTGIQF